MKVWMVYKINLDDNFVIDVCDSKEKAEELRDVLVKKEEDAGNNDYFSYYIHEQELNSEYKKHCTKLHRALK